ncbi:FAD-dependent monooxygenase [Amycolatopsis sp. cg5]|uniref:FAD-dependent monooxygenase n=1 Tax=Amycolatopsis sp. cg5 TaxID=3238802 RepID=UPI003525B18B
MPDEHVPVLVVGGSTVGLSTAVSLARYGIRPLLIERRDGSLIHPRATGLHPSAREFFRSVELEDQMREASAVLVNSLTKFSVTTLAGEDLSKVDRIATPPEDVVAATRRMSPTDVNPCAQDQIDRVLLAAAGERGVDVRFSTELESLSQDESGVTAVLLNRATGERSTVTADYLVGADGSSSRVRKELGITMEIEDRLGNPMIHVLFEADLTELIRGNEFNFCEIRHPDYEGLMLSINNKDRWVFHRSYSDDEETVDDYPEDRCLDLIKGAIGLPDLEVKILARLPWRISAGVAESVREGRIFLAGDAIHVIPPIGGFGMSTGIADAYNLGWKLAMVLNGQAGPGLLDSYAEERMPIAEFTRDQAVLRLKFMALHWDPRPEAEEERNALRIADPLVTSSGYQYSTGAVVGARAELPSLEDVEVNLDGSPGTRLPHLWVERKGEKISTLDLAGSGFTLLTGENGDAWHDAAEKIAAETGLPLTAYRVGKDIEDPGGTFGEATGITATGAVLVRPDNFVAWRHGGAHAEPHRHLSALLGDLLHRN